jgi:hypothetical protein
MLPIIIHNLLVDNFDNFKTDPEFEINLALISVHFEIMVVLISKDLRVRDLDSFSYKLIIVLLFSS